MTDARFPEKWLNDRRVTLLSLAGFRFFIYSLVWAAANRTDGILDAADTALIPGFRPELVEELIGSTLWELAPEGHYIITVFMDTQSTRAQLDAADNKRALDRERQARKRAIDRQSELDELRGERDSPRDVTRDRARDNKGQDRTGQARTGISTPDIPSKPVPLESVDRAVCAAPDCDRRPRNSCFTCATHMTDEPAYRRSA